jgi:exopolysaccharide biosynthesis polyprenyl glycosylphosphotransferase
VNKARKRKDNFQSVFRKYFLFFCDILLLAFSLTIYLIFFEPTINDFSDTANANPNWYIILMLIWVVYSYIFNLYSVVNASKTDEIIKRTIYVAFFTSITYLFIPFLSPVFPTHRLPFYFFLLQITLTMSIWHFIFATLFKNPILEKRAIIVGAGWSGREIAKVLLQNEKIYREKAYKIFGFIDDDPNKTGKDYESLRVLKNSDELPKYARRLKLDEIIIAVPYDKSISGKLYNALLLCEQEYNVATKPVNELYEEATGMVMVKQKNNEFYLNYPYPTKRSTDVYTLVNRLVNIGIGLVGVFMLLMVVPFIWLGNLFFNKGPLFYSQTRVGLKSRNFTIYKLRTMVPNAEKGTGAVWAQKNDARITAMGKWLRKSRLDELPQFWNILAGEMNLIGPRPERPEFVEKLLVTIPFYNTRHLVKPGITGWAQVNYKYGNEDIDSLRKLQYDLYYIKYRSVLLDIITVLRTFGVVAKFKGM